MEQWLIQNMLWVGLGIGIVLVGTKLLLVYFYHRLVMAEGKGPDQD